MIDADGVGLSVLVADDETAVRRAIRQIVEGAGYTCLEARDGADAIRVYSAHRPDLVILDVMMPNMDGFEACEAIRGLDQTVPVLFLSAKGDIVDQKMGYRFGADDYLVKPFSNDILLLRLGALRRRLLVERSLHERDASACLERVVLGDLVILPKLAKVMLAGEEVPLPPRQARIMVELSKHVGEVLSKDDIISAVWGREYVGTSISIPVYIQKLRKALEENPADPRYLHTVWGYGYSLYDKEARSGC